MSEIATQELARARAARIRAGIGAYLATLADVAAAYQQRDWQALGYADWQSYVDGEYSEHKLRLSPEHRQKAVAELRLAGMSQRAIGSALGIDAATVNRDLRGVADATPDAIQGADGKSYAATRPSQPNREPAEESVPDSAASPMASVDASEAPTDSAIGSVGAGDGDWPEVHKPAADPHAEGDARRDAELDAALADTAARFRANFSTARVKAGEITTFDPDRINDVYASNWQREVGDLLNALDAWTAQVRESYRARQRFGLRLIGGGR